MKKPLALMMAFVLSAVMTMPAYAETDAAASDVTVEIPGSVEVPIAFRDIESSAMSTTDTVSINGNTYSVDTAKFHYVLNLDPTMGYFCLTQDMAASLENYWMFDDPDSVQSVLIENGIHLFLMNRTGTSMVEFSEIEGDGFSSKVGTMQGQPTELLNAYTSILSEGLGAPMELVEIGGMPWICVNKICYLTIINGEYVSVMWEGAAEMTEYDTMDVQDILAGVVITGK